MRSLASLLSKAMAWARELSSGRVGTEARKGHRIKKGRNGQCGESLKGEGRTTVTRGGHFERRDFREVVQSPGAVKCVWNGARQEVSSRGVEWVGGGVLSVRVRLVVKWQSPSDLRPLSAVSVFSG